MYLMSIILFFGLQFRPILHSSSNFSNFEIQSGDVANSPRTHEVVRVFDIDNDNDGNMALYKVCSAPSNAVFQTIDPSKYHDYTSNVTTGKIIYAKYPSKVCNLLNDFMV
jgi:hypothetical protein